MLKENVVWQLEVDTLLSEIFSEMNWSRKQPEFMFGRVIDRRDLSRESGNTANEKVIYVSCKRTLISGTETCWDS